MKWLLIAFQLLPNILAAIVQVENSVNAPGATKKAIVMGAITSAAKVGEAVPNQATDLISTMIDSTVKTLNDSGVFPPKAPTPAPAA
jgi:hypothetical protein